MLHLFGGHASATVVLGLASGAEWLGAESEWLLLDSAATRVASATSGTVDALGPSMVRGLLVKVDV